MSFPSFAKYRIRRIAERIAGGRRHALRLARAALRRGDSIADALLVYRAERLFDQGRSREAEGLWRLLWEKAPASAERAIDVARAARWRTDYAEAERVLLAARESGARSETLDTLIDYYQRSLRRSNSALADAMAMVDSPATPASRLFWASVYLSAEGDFETARRGLTRLLQNRRLAGQARTQLAALDVIERNGTSDRVPGWFSPERRSALIRARSELLVIVFLSPTGWIGMPANAFHAVLGREPLNVLYLSDSRDLFHLRGTDHFGGDYQAMIAGLKSLARELGATRVVTVGASTTGYTALRVAIDIEADAVLAFAPVTSMAPGDMLSDGRLPALREKLLARVAEFATDAKPGLAALGGRLRAEIFYAPAHVEDAWHAERLGGLAGVRLHRVENSVGHDVLGELLLRGEHETVATLLRATAEGAPAFGAARAA